VLRKNLLLETKHCLLEVVPSEVFGVFCVHAMYVILSLQGTFSENFNTVAVQILLCALLPFNFYVLQVMLKIHAQRHSVMAHLSTKLHGKG